MDSEHDRPSGADSGDATDGASPVDPQAAQPPEESDPTRVLTPEEVEAAAGPVSDATVLMDSSELPEYPTDPNDPLIGTLMRGKWRVLGRIGAGSFGTVYKVRDETGGWIEALKILSVDRMQGPQADNMRKRFLREAQIMKRLGGDSQHIVGLSTYEEDLEEGQIYFLMEYVEGRVLSDVIREEGTFSVERAVRLGLQVCDALMAAHEGPEPVVHRDLKLENLMLTTDRNGEEMVKVLDFGIAKITERESDSKLTTAGTLGTPGYAAPEQLRAGNVDGRTDLFAFGVILYSLLTGRNPWLGHLAHQSSKQTFELMAASDRAEVLPISETGIVLPAPVTRLIMKLLKRDPDERYQSARELRDALLALGNAEGGTQGLPPVSLIGTSTGPPPSTGGRRLAAVWFADIVGYSSLSSVDESAALELLKSFHTVGRESIEEGGGRVVQFIGDAVFAEFASTERAVLTAMDFYERFTATPPASAEAEYDPELRIGVHVGDVHVAEDGDVFGDGVNTAARIQGAAEPGQILVSSAVWGQLKQRREFVFHSMGEHALKGLGNPMELFQVLDQKAAAAAGIEAPTPTGTLDGIRPIQGKAAAKSRLPMAIAGVAVLAAIGYAGVTFMGGGDTAGDSLPPSTPPAVEANNPEEGAGEQVAQNDDANSTVDPVEAEPAASQPVVTSPPPQTTARPNPGAAARAAAESGFQEAASGVSGLRNQARASEHASLRAAVTTADAAWTRAQSAASEGRFEDATRELESARTGYQAVVTADGRLDAIVRQQAALDGLRGAATDAGLIAQATTAERLAEQAATEGRYDAAEAGLREASFFLTRAAEAPAATPQTPAAPTIVPGEIASRVLAELEAAMEAEDLGRVRQIWTSISGEQAQGLEGFFNGVSGLDVGYSVTSSTLRGSTVIAVVGTTYRFSESNDPVSAPTLTFEMEERGGSWLIVRSREGG